jgi:flagellar biosynthetic protein FliQ
MTPQMAIELTHRALMMAVMLAAPVLVTAMVVGVVLNIIQTVTSIKDMSLTFVPKALIVVLVVSFSLPWAIQIMNNYIQEMYVLIIQMGP